MTAAPLSFDEAMVLARDTGPFNATSPDSAPRAEGLDVDEVGRRLHDELRGPFGDHVRGHNEPESYGPGAGWCHCRSVAERILSRPSERDESEPNDG